MNESLGHKFRRDMCEALEKAGYSATDAKRISSQAEQHTGNGKHAPATPVPNGTRKRPPLCWLDMSAWDNEPEPKRDWFIQNRIPMRQPTLFSGEGAVGKSLLTLHLLASTALARDWCGLLPEPGGAWYIGAEDDKTELHIRMAGILRHYNASYADLAAGGFRMMSLYGEDAVLGAPNRSGIITPTELYEQIYEQAGDIKPKCIALDASADMFAGDEINRAQVRQFVGLLRRLSRASAGAVILLSHPSLTGINSGSGLSGSTAWHNSVRARMYLTSPKPEAGEQPDCDLRELSFKKANYSELGSSLVLRWRDGLFLPEAGASSLDKAEREMQAETHYLAQLKKLIGQGQTVSPQRTSPYYGPSIMGGKGIRKKDLEAAQQRLLDDRKIHIRNEGKPSRARLLVYPGAAA